jgi:hypothetical protein
MELPIPWSSSETEEQHLDQVAPQVTLDRLPAGITSLRDPASWDDEELLAWREHIRLGQKGQLPAKNVFQFKTTAVDEVDEYCESIHPASQLRYSPLARLWVARLFLQAPNDDLARAELAFQLPVLDSKFPVYDPLSDEDMLVAKDHARGNEEVLKLLVYMVDYERTHPIKVSGNTSTLDQL